MNGNDPDGEARPSPSLVSDRARDVYVDALRRAMRHAAAHVPHDEAREIAHHVAVSVVGWAMRSDRGCKSDRGLTSDNAPPRSLDGFIHRAVINRLRDLWRASRSRRAAEALYREERGALAPAWTQPDAELESKELQRVIDGVIGEMPEAMRRIFLLVRRDQRSYRDVAAELGVGVGTVHTQLSRANARLRQAVGEYRAAGHSKTSAEITRTAGVRS